jgi:uncharacterized protein (TIGR02594 family)
VIGETVPVQEFDSPGTRTLTPQQPFGTKRPSDDVIKKVDDVLKTWPAGPRPIDIAQAFIDRYSATDPAFIAQTPRPDPWNPLIVRFFSATSLKVSNDMVDWCAAFVNWCLSRNHKPWSNNAGSQSFINSGKFAETKTPKLGDIVVFTCYDSAGKSLGIGHVGFFKAALDADHIRLVAGNQGGDGHSSIISERTYSTKPSPTTRHINGKAVPCTFKFNRYLSVP